MSRTIFRHRQTTGFFSLIAAALFVGTASLAQAQNWNVPIGQLVRRDQLELPSDGTGSTGCRRLRRHRQWRNLHHRRHGRRVGG